LTAFDSIIKKLSPLGIYKLNEGSNVYNEIMAYCTALDAHRENIDKVLRECFISSAEDYGIENREKIIGSPRTDYNLQQRRDMLIGRKASCDNDFTVENFGELLSSIGVYDYKIDESPNTFEIAFDIRGSYNSVDEAWIENQINLMVPSHLDCSVYMCGVTWSTLDSIGATFDILDKKNVTWTEFNSLK
jgi:hypothetical protein